MTPSEKVGLLPGFRWVVDSLPSWLAPLFALLVTFGLLWVLAVGVEGRIPNLHAQYRGVWPGDAFLSLAYMSAVTAALFCLPASVQGWWQATWWHWTALGVGLSLALLLKVGEVIATVNMPGQPGVYSWGQHLSPTMFAHTIIVPVMAYLILTLGSAALWSPTIPWVLKALVIAGVVGWAVCALVLDNTLPRPDVNLIHVPDGWWWQRTHFWR